MSKMSCKCDLVLQQRPVTRLACVCFPKLLQMCIQTTIRWPKKPDWFWKKKKKTCLENPTQTCSSHDLYLIRNTAMFPIIVQVFDHKVRTTDTPPSFSSWLWRKRQLDKGGVANLHWGDKLSFKWVGGWIGIGVGRVGGGRSGGRLRHSSEQWHIWGSTPHPHPQPPPRGPASLPCEHRKRCVNFCLVPLSPSSSKWSTSTTVRGEQGEADWAVSREVGGGGRWTPHTDFLCARGRGLQYYSDRGGMGGGFWNGWSITGGKYLTVGLLTPWSTLSCVCIESVTCLSDSAQRSHRMISCKQSNHL